MFMFMHLNWLVYMCNASALVGICVYACASALVGICVYACAFVPVDNVSMLVHLCQ